MKLSGAWLEAPGTQAVLGMLAGAGHQAFVVGGCVRNALLGTAVADVDIATDARPDRVAALAEAAGFTPVPTGIAHGTVTVVADGEPYEVTTFRKDVQTDGRRAVVAYSDRIEEDARRRDFTVNALYARADGSLVDPLGGGLDDLGARRIRFIEDAATRIREDYLRILRYFRFLAWYGDPGSGPDAAALDACARHAEGLAGLSKERVGAEIRKLLAARDPAPSLALMAASGVLARVLPGADPRSLAPLVHLEAVAGLAPRWQRRLRSLGGHDWTDALRLSRKEQRELGDLDTALAGAMPPGEAAYRFGSEIAADAVLIGAAAAGSQPPPGWAAEIADGAGRQLPVRAADLLERHGAGPDLGAALARLERDWIASGFALDRDALLAIDSDRPA